MTAVVFPASRNPFRTERLDRLGYRSPATGERAELDPLLWRFESLGRHAAVVGPEGSGKTTLLDGLAPRFADRGLDVRRLRAVSGGGALQGAAGPGHVLEVPEGPALRKTLWVVDGYDRIGFRERVRIRRAARGAAGLLVTTHRRPRMPILEECATTPRLLAVLVAELADSGASWESVLPAARTLHGRHGGNLRTALLELYDRAAGRVAG